MSTNDLPIIVGLTGGIASGKSTISAMLAGMGAVVVDADAIARKVVEPGAPALAEIVEAFGPGVLDAAGALERKRLGAEIFADAAKRHTLNAIMQPRIAMAMRDEAREARAKGATWVIYDAALLVENGAYRGLDSLIVVALTPQVQLERLMARDGLGPQEAAQRIAAQMPLADKVAVADYVIDNSQDLACTKIQVERVFEAICEGVRHRDTARPPGATSPGSP